jgi:RNA polymerase sigma-70 factor (ECF subfamily)
MAAASLGVIILGQTNISIQSAHAATLLRSAAEQTIAFSDPTPGPGEYLRVHTHANWLVSGNMIETHMNAQNIDVYVPGDASRDWVLDRDWGAIAPRPGQKDTIHAPDGEFYGIPWTVINRQEIQDLPREGKALIDHFNAQYQGGSASRDEDNFVRITDLLRTGLIPADLRAGLYEALALIPGVNASEQTNFDGKPGIAIGRSEPLRAGQRDEIIIDPDTGLVIGERVVTTYAIFGLGANNLVAHTAIDYNIVGSVPPANQPAQDAGGPEK